MKRDAVNDPIEVIKLQGILTILGFDTPYTGVFDDLADANVRLFQALHTDEVLKPWFDIGEAPDLNPTGYVFKTTLWKINDLACGGGLPFPTLS